MNLFLYLMTMMSAPLWMQTFISTKNIKHDTETSRDNNYTVTEQYNLHNNHKDRLKKSGCDNN